MEDVVLYIIRFLLGESIPEQYSDMIGYTSDEADFNNYKVVIVPCGMFDEARYGKLSSLPELPLPNIEDIPLLYGKPVCYFHGETLVTTADIIASAYFMLSRYEEYVCRDKRDEHGRFSGRDSLQYKAGFIDRPVVDEYGFLLRKWLRKCGVEVPEPEKKIRKVWLTHDVDAPFFCRTLRNVIRETVKGTGFFKAMSCYCGDLAKDPYFTFPWILAKDSDVRENLGADRCDIVFFLKAGGRTRFDKPLYDFSSSDVKKMLEMMKGTGALFGLHSSYESGGNPEIVSAEKNNIEMQLGICPVRYNRNHFLRSCEPENFKYLIDAGIEEDFTMGYADVSGFRIGTSRPARWIDPHSRSLTGLVMHPLLIMDCTLSDDKYMGLKPDEAYSYCMRLIGKVKEYGGELVLLWHNTSFAGSGNGFDHRNFYSDILARLE